MRSSMTILNTPQPPSRGEWYTSRNGECPTHFMGEWYTSSKDWSNSSLEGGGRRPEGVNSLEAVRRSGGIDSALENGYYSSLEGGGRRPEGVNSLERGDNPNLNSSPEKARSGGVKTIHHYLIALIFLLSQFDVVAQIRLLNFDPTADQLTIKNFGTSTVDISSYRLCALLTYTSDLTTLTVESGSLNLTAGAQVILSGWALTDAASDLGIFLGTGAFSDAAAMVDFTQWGSAGNGRESVAVTKGIWTAGDFISGNAPYAYTGDGLQNGLSYWISGLIAHYTFSGDATDQSGNGNDGTVNGATLTTDRFGNANSAYSFDGVDDYILVNNDATLNFSEQITVSAWINLNNVGSQDQALVSKGDIGFIGYLLNVFGTGRTNPGIIEFGSQSFSLIEGVTRVDDNQLHHVVGTYDGASLKIFIDGVLDNEQVTSGSLSVNSGPLYIGAHETGGAQIVRYTNGSIDDIRIYNRALSATEISDLNALESGAFITTWQTTTASESITIPTFTGETYNYTVNWGDGTVESGFTGDASHTYASAGTHTVSITESFPRIYFNNSGTNLTKIMTIEQWGNIAWTSMEGAFETCSNLTYNATDSPDLSEVTSLNQMFRAATLFNGAINSWDVSNVTDMRELFRSCPNFNQPLNSWNVSNVTTMVGMFDGSSSFNGDLSSWDVSNVADMEAMFASASSFNQPLNSWDMSSVTNMPAMFSNATSFNQPLASWDVSGNGNFDNVFQVATAFNQPLNSWNVGNGTRMELTFSNASSFDQDLASWNISSVTTMVGMLDNSGMSTENYDNTLVGWASLDAGESQIPTSITLGASGVTYCNGETARNTLIGTHSWTISGDTKDCSEYLIAHYTFTGDATDQSGNGYDGTVNGATLTTDRFGNANSAYAFDGSSTITFNNTSNVDLGDETTVTAWVYSNSYSAGEPEFISNGLGSTGFDFKLSTGTSNDAILRTLKVETFGGDFLTTSELNLNQWYHVAFTYKRNEALTLYVDGMAIGSNTSVADQAIGISSKSLVSGANGMNGSIDDLAIYSRALSAAEISDLYDSEKPNDLVAHYTFSGDATDQSGNGNDATPSGGVALTTDRNEATDQAYIFDGTDDKFTLPFNPEGGDAMTVTAWVYRTKSNGTNVNQGILSNDVNATDRGVIFGIIGGSGNEALHASFTNDIGMKYDVSGVPVPDSQWMFCATTYDGTTFKLFQDDQMTDSQAASGLFAGTTNFEIGHDTFDGDAGRWFGGKLDEVRIYTRALTDAEILALYDVEKPGGGNNEPTDILLSEITIDENQASGTAIGTLSTTDADAANSHTYSLVSGTGSTDNASFTISSDQLVSAEVFDFETKSSYTVRIQTDDGNGGTFAKAFAITILDVDEGGNNPPTDILLSETTIDENQASGTAIGTLSTTDTDAANSHTYSLVSGTGSTDNASFSIASNQLLSAEAFDFETKSSYTVRIQTDDGNEGIFAKEFTITINDLFEGLSLSIPSFPNAYAKGGSGVTVTIGATDPNNDITGVSVYFKNISDDAFISISMSEASGSYSATIGDAEFDDLGIVLFFEATDGTNTVQTEVFAIATLVAANTASITSLKVSADQLDYAIISMPYQSVGVTTILAELGDYDNEKWRLFHYNGSGNQEFPSFSTFEPGRGYWFLNNSVSSISLGEGTSVLIGDNSPFNLSLRNGQNQIGNPFPFGLDWQAVIDHNAANGITVNPLTVWRAGTGYSADVTSLSKFQGAFLSHSANQSIEIPITAINPSGRTADVFTTVPNSGTPGFGNWTFGLNMDNGTLKYNVSTVGMNDKANTGRDDMDMWPLPRLYKHLDLIFDNGNTQDMVQVMDFYKWSFEVQSNFESEPITLSWDNLPLLNSDYGLFLVDVERQLLIDLSGSSAYQFTPAGSHHGFELYFGMKSDLQLLIHAERNFMGDPYPNPTTSELIVPISTTADQAHVRLAFMDLSGRVIFEWDNPGLGQGFHELGFDLPGILGNAVQAGTYIIQMRIENAGNVALFYKKIIFQK